MVRKAELRRHSPMLKLALVIGSPRSADAHEASQTLGTNVDGLVSYLAGIPDIAEEMPRPETMAYLVCLCQSQPGK